MPISDYSSTASSNTAISGINIAEGCNPSGINDAIRQMMADIAADAVTRTSTQTLTNKTLTAPVISTISNTGTLTLPTSTDTLVGRATTDTLTNKTLTSPVLTGPQVTSGGIIMTNGAVAGSTTLDWYEEGTFTPTVIGASPAGSGTYTTQVGLYTRIGRICYFSIHLVWTAHTGGGGMFIGGLPFTSTASLRTPISLRYDNFLVGSARQFTPEVADSSTLINCQNSDPAGGAGSFFAIDTAASLWLSGFYHIA